MRLCALGSYAVFCATLVGAPGGCSTPTDNLGRQAVNGTVTLDGQPLASGSIQFQPSSQDGATSGGAVITGGKFSISQEEGLPPGSYKVVIRGSATSPGGALTEPPGTAKAVEKELIPERYNEKTTLTAEVKASGPNTFDFPLKK
jgi:hypothetical protein